MQKFMYKDNGGHITVETVGTFVPLVLLMISILSLVNIVAVQARVQYALAQTAMTLSVYSYALEATGLSNSQSSKTPKEAGAVAEDLSSIIVGIRSMTHSSTAHSGDEISTIENLVNSAKSSATNLALDMLIQPIIREYLTNSDMSGDEYLKRSGIVNMWLKSVELPNNNGNNGDVKLTIQYEIDYSFGALPLPFGPTLSVTQTAITKGWLNGSGEGYW